MRAKWMGVAVAAVMGCGFGGVERAEAAPLSVDVTADAYYDSVDYGQVQLNFTSNSLVPDIENNFIEGLFSISSSFKNESTNSTGFFLFGRNFNGLNEFQLNIRDAGQNVSTSLNFFINRDLPVGLVDLSQIALFSIDGEGAIRSNSPSGFYLLRNVEFTITGDVIKLSSVPLPASAPLFGIALLALGGIGYASRRGKVKAA